MLEHDRMMALQRDNERLQRIIHEAEDFIPATKVGELERLRAENERLRAELTGIIEEYDSPKLRDDNSDLYRAIDSARGTLEQKASKR